MPDYFAFDPHPRVPSVSLPALACDSQFHVFGPRERYPVQPGAVYEMPSATIERALALHATLGFQRGVIVQATTYGADHQVVLDGLAAAGPNYRGCANASVLKMAPDSYLDRLNAAGVRGARFSRAGLGISLSPQDVERALGRVRELGWYVKIQPHPDDFPTAVAPFETLDVPLVIDHMGRPDPRRGLDDPNLRKVLDLLGNGNVWVMLSLGEKTSKAGAPWNDVVPLAQTLIQAAPDRCIWGSDWPHPVSTSQPPNDADLLELLFRYAPDETRRRRILVDNPAALFGFPTAGEGNA